MFNFALGWAFLISAIASPGGKVMALVVDAAVIRTLPPYQQVLTTIFANYWIPAILLYWILKAIRADRFLNTSFGIHVLFGIANFILTVYAGLRIFTATVEGGGATYALGIIGTIVAVPCWLALSIGSMWLLKRSIKSDGFRQRRGATKDQVQGLQLHTVAAVLMLLPPFLFFGWLYITKADAIQTASHVREAKSIRFEELCNSIRIDIIKTATDAKSVLFYDGMSPIGYGLLNNLDFIEVKWGEWQVPKGEGLYKRYRKPEGQKAIVNGRVNALAIESSHESEAQYEIKERWITNEVDKAHGFYVKETTIQDRRTGEALGIFTKVVDNSSRMLNDSNFCPRGFEPPNYEYEMSLFILGLMDKSSSEKFTEKIALFQK